jgi:hypothetical protein
MSRNPNNLDWSGGLPVCIDSFSVIEDPRTDGNKLHRFDCMDTAILCAL